jgi:hypothetical protein
MCAALVMDRHHNVSMSKDDLWPVTITRSRYGGIYEPGDWVAFAELPHRLPDDWDAGDLVCARFWADHAHEVGGGSSPEEAYADLKRKMDARNVSGDA